MEFKQILGSIRYTNSDWRFIRSMPSPLTNSCWNKPLPRPPWNYGDSTKIDNLKKYIRRALNDLQGLNCAYCGLPLEETSGEQIEHIASRSLYPQFIFWNNNLVLSCSYCNGFLKKERQSFRNTIATLNSNYNLCLFNIVHPYFDDPKDHFSFSTNKNFDIIINHKTLKGQKSIYMFKLDEPIQASARGKVMLKNKVVLSPDTEALIKEVLKNDYS